MRVLFASCLLLATTAGWSPAAEPWPAFQHKLAIETDQLPVEWAPGKNLAWELELPGYGQSSPIAWEDQVYVTTVSGAMKEQFHVLALAAATGKERWQHSVEAAFQEKNTTYTSRAAPTPVADARGLIAFFESGNLVALDHEGAVRWERSLVEDYGPIEARHGLASSLEQDADHIFVWVERQADPYVLAISKQSGKTVWKAGGLGVTTWSSPRLIPVGQSHQLVLSGIGRIAGYQPDTGEQLWTFDEIAGNSTPTPIPLGDGKFLIGASEGRGSSGGGPDSNGVIQISSGDDGAYEASWLWQARRATSSFGSPIAHDGLAYFVNRVGVVYCLDIETGKELYAKRTSESIWATPIVNGDRVYLFGKSGTTSIIRAGKRFELAETNPLWELQQAQPAARGAPSFGGPVLYAAIAIGPRLLLRRGDRLFAIQN